MKLDQVTTIAIGRIDASGRHLSPREWSQATEFVQEDAEGAGGTIVAQGTIAGVTSDQTDEQAEDSFVAIVINADETLRWRVANTLAVFGLSSACFAQDANHEPVFPTTDGFRPENSTPTPDTAATHAPAHGGFPGTVVTR